MGKALAFIISFIIICTVTISHLGCANIIPPAGGPRDSLPPRLINASPHDSTRNFRGDRIVLTFDEYIKLQDVQGNILVTPTLESNPPITERGKTITIHFKDSLASNTTYSINFGNTIRDVNEGNILRNFTYVFSTGPTLDSLELHGKVVVAETGRVDSTLIVVLHRDLSDSAVKKIRPVYVTRLDGKGNFHFKNLPAGTFAIYALKDAMNKRYDSTQLFAFADAPVVTGKTDNVTLYAYQKTRAAPSATNTSNLPRSVTDKRLQFSTNATGNQQDLLNDLILTFSTPLKTFDSTKVNLSDSSYTKVPYSVALDSLRKEIRFKTAWQEGMKYSLILNKDFAEDTSGRKLLKSDTLHFITRNSSDYGKLTVRLKNVDAAKNPVLQFVQNDNVVFSVPISSGIFIQQLFLPGDYNLRVLYDTNGNGKWDPGNFFGIKRQPEIVVPIERKITVKANADNDFEIQL